MHFYKTHPVFDLSQRLARKVVHRGPVVLPTSSNARIKGSGTDQAAVFSQLSEIPINQCGLARGFAFPSSPKNLGREFYNE